MRVLVRQRDATKRRSARREAERDGEYESNRVFTVRPGCRSPLSSIWSLSLSPGWELNAWMAKRKPRATLKMSASHNGVTAATRRRIYNRALFIFYWATFGLHTSRNSQETHAAHPRARILSTLGTSSIIPVDESWVKFEQTVFNDGAMHVRFWKATL